MSRSRLALLLLLVAVVVLLAWYNRRNPEDRVLDQMARSAGGGRYVTLSGGVTHYSVSGPDSGAPVVLVHGFSVPSYIWDSTAVALAGAGYRVVQYDLFGRGFSDRPRTTYDADLVDRQLQELLDSLGIRDPVHLMGLSYGGFVTGTFAGRHPERVRSLTLVDPAAGQSGALPWFINLPVLGPLIWQALVVPGLAEGQRTDFVDPSRWPDWVDRYRVQMQFRGFGRALWSTALNLATVNLDSVYRTVGAQSFPVALVWGVEDSTVSIRESDGVRKAIPRLQFHPIELAAHLPHMERTEVVNPILRDFLRNADSVSRKP